MNDKRSQGDTEFDNRNVMSVMMLLNTVFKMYSDHKKLSTKFVSICKNCVKNF